MVAKPLIVMEKLMKTTTWGAVALAMALLVGGATQLDAQGWQDGLITRAFAEVLQREPSPSELRRYRDLMYEEHWSERDIQDDLRHRPDYQRHSQRRIEDPDGIVRRAYQDILHREPDTQGLRQYRSRLIDDNWTEYQVREALRKSPEHAERSAESADKIVRRAYQDVREALRKSPEYRQKNAMTREQAEQIVRRAYLSVLGREPDPASRGFVDRVLRDHWDEGDVARELRNSDEYRNRRR
jgi:TorA maturation chaperone TorD